MQLSAEAFYAITGSLRSYAPGAKGVDKRKSPRVGIRADAAVRLIEHGKLCPPITIAVRDLSKSGIGLMFHKAIPVGSQMMLFLSGPKQPQGMSVVMYTVMCCRPLSDGHYSVGAQICSSKEMIPFTEADVLKRELADLAQRLRG